MNDENELNAATDVGRSKGNAKIILPFNKKVNVKPRRSITSPSDTTIYTPAIPMNGSSDDMDTSSPDEGMEIDENEDYLSEHNLSEMCDKNSTELKVVNFLAEQRKRVESGQGNDRSPQPSTSTGIKHKKRRRLPSPPPPPVQPPARRRDADGSQARQDAIDEAKINVERSRINMIKPGKNSKSKSKKAKETVSSDEEDSEEDDEEFFEFSAHVDDKIIQKIKEGKFVDLAKLLPKDNPSFEEDDDENDLQFVTKGGKTFYLPAVGKHRDQSTINSYSKWEAAFQVYVGIYTKANPERNQEMIQHIFNIRSAARDYAWSNVYAYDQLFRHMMSKNPHRNWGKIVTRSWVNVPREPIVRGNNGHNSKQPKKQKDCCWRFNRGECTDENCCFQHKCWKCGLTNHGAHKCRKGKTNNKEAKPSPPPPKND